MNSSIFGGNSVGTIVDGRFPLLRWLGGTARSSVFLTQLASDPAQKAAIKFIRGSAVDQEACLAQWQMAKGLSHPHLVRLFEAGRCVVDGEEYLYAVTEYAEEVLSEVLPERALTADEVREMLGPVLDALSYLHGQGLVHGHLKPSNLLAVHDQLKLSVDGVHSANDAPASTLSGVCDPPESGSGSAASAADVWSLGVLLVETLTQRPPDWTASSRWDPVVPASVPAPFFEIAQQSLRVHSEDRITVADIKNLLDPNHTPKPAPKAAPAPVPEQPRVVETKTGPSKIQIWVLGGAVLLLLAVFGAIKLSSPRTPQADSPDVAAPQSSSQEAPSTDGSVVKGSVANRVMPDVPEFAQRTIRGHVPVEIRVQVDANGDVSHATVDSAGASRYFPKLALQTAQDWKFKPALKNGRPVASVWILQFQFEPAQTHVSAEEVAP
ncbi:MAG: TonB family protein [Terracidiphilus sp.]|nr:TonB family protein [Terracidiphilus sp.]